MTGTEREVLDLSIEVMERTGGLDIHAPIAVKELVEVEARWGEAVRRMMAER